MESVDFAAAPAVVVSCDIAPRYVLGYVIRPYRCLLGSRRVVDAVLLVKSSVVVAVVSANE